MLRSDRYRLVTQNAKGAVRVGDHCRERRRRLKRREATVRLACALGRRSASRSPHGGVVAPLAPSLATLHLRLGALSLCARARQHQSLRSNSVASPRWPRCPRLVAWECAEQTTPVGIAKHPLFGVGPPGCRWATAVP